jgi:hypothetical protein
VVFKEPPAIEHDGKPYDDDAHQSLLLEARQQLRRARAAEDFSAVREAVEEHLMWERAWLPAASEEFVTLLKAIADAQLAVVEEELRRLEGGFRATPELIPLVDENDTWAAAVPAWINEAGPEPKTVDDVKAQVARFERLVGPLPLSALTPAHVAQFKAACLEQEGVGKVRVNNIVALLLVEAMDKLEFPGLELGHLPYAGPGITPAPGVADTGSCAWSRPAACAAGLLLHEDLEPYKPRSLKSIKKSVRLRSFFKNPEKRASLGGRAKFSSVRGPTGTAPDTGGAIGPALAVLRTFRQSLLGQRASGQDRWSRAPHEQVARRPGK